MKKNIVAKLFVMIVLFLIGSFIGMSFANKNKKVEQYQWIGEKKYLASETINDQKSIDEIEETKITRIEEQEKIISREYWNWWKPIEYIPLDNGIVDILVPQQQEKQIKSFKIEKTATKVNGKEITKVRPGDIIEYQITITNTGNTTLENITVTDSLKVTVDGEEKEIDPNTGVSTIAIISSLSAEEGKNTKTIITYYTVTSEDVEQKETLKNTVIASVPEGPTEEDQEEVPVNPDIPIILTKIWEDNGNKLKLRPSSVEFIINNKEYKLTGENDENIGEESSDIWTIKVKLPKYDLEGNEINYSATENTVSTGYEKISEEGTTIINKCNVTLEQKGSVTVKGVTSSTETISTPMDVVFVLDTSGSMQYAIDTITGNSKATAMVNAVNSSIKTIMNKNAESRIGVVGFSGECSTMIELGKYAQNTNYLDIDNNKIISKVGKKNSRTVTGGTNTQAGIKAGAEMLINATDKKYITSINGKEVKVTRTPVLILVTDGEPTYYYKSENASSTLIGDGGAWTKSDENYYYWTIRTAKYYKDKITSKYYGKTKSKSKAFTIGIGMSGDKATVMLNPNETNVKACDTNGYDNQMGNSQRNQTGKLYDLLNSNGTPYAYDYADGTKSGSLTEKDIESFLITSINQSEETSDVRGITEEEAKNRKIQLIDLDDQKEFELLIGKDTYNSIDSAKKAGYLKEDQAKSYYIDLTEIDADTNVNVTYWKK